jgi:hypothetical protein
MSNLTDQISIGCAVNSAIMIDAISKKELIESSKNVVKKLNIVPPKIQIIMYGHFLIHPGQHIIYIV